MWSRFVMSQVKHNSYFLCGVALGLWVSLAVIPLDEEPGCALVAGAGGGSSAAPDEFEPQREERPLGPAGQSAGRSVQRPRYYSTELGMRGSLLSGVLSSEDALKTQVAALNQTMARLQPALKFFITASAMSSVPGLANVVGFTDTREMLKPFHALKYLADNYLEEYDFFFLISDGAFVNARRLTELVSKLSVSQDVYMGTIAEDDSHYCSLESGIILSNSVLRAVHGELDWCVRNSYSPHHHENLGRCVLHAAHLSCSHTHQGERYSSVRLEESGAAALSPALAAAVSARPASPPDMHRLHAYVARMQLERARSEAVRLRVEMWKLAPRHPPGARNASWPAGLRTDPGLAPPAPDTRFDHLRWTLFNASHAFMPDEHRAVAPLLEPTKQAIQLVLENVEAWARRRWAWARDVALLEGAWQWEPPVALRYRLLLKLSAPDDAAAVRLVEVARALGSARLVPARYVTESARVRLVLPLPLLPRALPRAAPDARALLARYRALPHAHTNTQLYIVSFVPADMNSTTASALLAPIREGIASVVAAHGAAELVEGGVLEGGLEEDAEGEVQLYERAGLQAAQVLGPRLPGDALMLLIVPHLEFNQDFLNRVRMNSMLGAAWFSALPFARHALHAHPRHRAARTRTGRFNPRAHALVAFYSRDLQQALALGPVPPGCGCACVLARSALRGIVSPEPGAVLPPRPRPCPAAAPASPASPAPAAGACPRGLRLDTLDLGNKNSLAQLLLETQHENE